MKYVVLLLVVVILFLLVTRVREARLGRGGVSSGARIRIEGLLAQGREADAVTAYQRGDRGEPGHGAGGRRPLGRRAALTPRAAAAVTGRHGRAAELRPRPGGAGSPTARPDSLTR